MANCIHCSVPFSIRDLSICRFCYLFFVLIQIHLDTEGQLKFEGGDFKVTCALTVLGVNTPSPNILQGSFILGPPNRSHV